MLRSHPLRRGRPDPAPLYPASRAGERDRQGRAARQVALRRPPGAVLPPRPRALRGPQRPADRHERGDARRPSAAARARRRRSTAPRAPATPSARLFDDGDPHAGVYHLLANELALLDARAASAPTRANALAFRLKLLLAAGFAPQLAALRLAAASASTSSASPAPPAASSAAPARRARSGSTRRRTTSSSPRSAARSPRRPSAPQRALAQAERAIPETLEHHAHVRLRPRRWSRRVRIRVADDASGSTTSPRARATCATCSAARAPTSPR